MYLDELRRELLISIHALLAESDSEDFDAFPFNDISIHALLAESDLAPEVGFTAFGHFYPRSPCGERHQRRSEKNSET